MKKVIALILVILMLGITGIAERDSYSVVDLIPDTSQWEYSRTKFKESNGSAFQDIEINGLKGYALPGFDVDGYPMTAYYEFATKHGNYYGLSRVIYLLDVPKKVSDTNLVKCYKALVKDMTSIDKPTSSGQTSSVWEYEDCSLEIVIEKFSDFNGSKYRTVAVVFAAPVENTQTGNKGSGRKMTVSASASCSDYNHVGNDWSQSFYLNGTQIGRNSEITLSAGDTITVEATITESDKSPDVGNGGESYTVTQSDISNGFTIRFNVDVRENKGRYSGSVATWSVKFTFQ